MQDRALIAVAGLLLTVSTALGQTVLKREPPPGQLSSGAVVLVDDRSCPKGQIKQVTAGSNLGREGRARGGNSPRIRRCIPR